MASKSSVFQQLAALGITESAEQRGMLTVSDPELLNNFASNIRADPELLPPNWPTRMRNLLGGMLRSLSDDEDATAMMNDFFKKSALDRMYQRDVTGAIGSSSTSSGNGGGSEDDFFSSSSSGGVGFQPPKLLDEQQQIVEYAMKGYNMFICGDAGTGKTVTLKELVRTLRAQGLIVAVTASTGLAACHLGGTTFHSFSGIGKSSDFLQSTKAMPIADVVVIDEISMLSGGLMEKFDHFLRGERNCSEPFGGTQIIICGDFLQLSFIAPPKEACRRDPSANKHVFELDFFRNHFLLCKLVKQVRQQDNDRFAGQLRELRTGMIPADLFAETSGIAKVDDSSEPVEDETIRLLPTNEQVANANKMRLDKLPGEVVSFVPSATPPTLSGDWSTSVILEVKPDMFNLDGFRHNLHKFMLDNIPMDMAHYVPRSSIVVYHTHEDGVVARLMMPTQKPDVAAKVAVAWEKAIGKMPSLTIDMQATTLTEPSGKIIEVLPNGHGLHTAYIEERLNGAMKDHPVAQTLPLKIGAPVLLRVNLSNRLVNGSVGTVVDYVPATPEKLPSFLLKSPRLAKALEQYTSHARFALGNDDPMIPLVRFRGSEKQDVPIPPWPFNVGGDIGTNYYSIDAISIPLTLAFAFTVHKVQGLTLLSKVRLELEKMWKCPHIVYVAMSRVKRPEQLSISGWKDELVIANQDAVKFDANVPPVTEVNERLLKKKNFHLTEISSESFCNNSVLGNLTRAETMCRATWWRLMHKDFTTGMISSNLSSVAVALDGAMRTGTSTGTFLNAKQANRVFKRASEKNFSFSSNKKRPSLLINNNSNNNNTVHIASTKQHRAVVEHHHHQQQHQQQSAASLASASTSTTSPSSIVPPLFLKKSSTKNEDPLRFAEPKSATKMQQKQSTPAAKDTLNQQQPSGQQ